MLGERGPDVVLEAQAQPPPQANDAVAVPDPWYGGPSGFEDVYEIIERSVSGLLESLKPGRVTQQ